MSKPIKYIPFPWQAYSKHLNGVFCIYKPTGFSLKATIDILKKELTNGMKKQAILYICKILKSVCFDSY